MDTKGLILVVETIRTSWQRRGSSLEATGMRCGRLPTEKKPWNLLSQCKPDLMLLDVMMHRTRRAST